MQNTAPEKVTVQVYVDNQTVGDATAYMVNDELYVPLKALGRAANRRVSYTDGTVTVFRSPAAAGRPLVDPVKATYYTKISDAMDLLQAKAPEHYKKLTEYVETILPGLDNATLPEVNVVTVSLTDLDKGTVTWIAGTLAHEAEHLRIYHTDRALYANAKENERPAYEANLDALRLVGADQREIDWTLKALKDPPTWEDVAK